MDAVKQSYQRQACLQWICEFIESFDVYFAIIGTSNLAEIKG